MRNRTRNILLLATLPATLFIAVAEESSSRSGTATLRGQILFEGGKALRGIAPGDAVVYLQGDGLALSKEVSGGQTESADGGAPPILDQRDITFVPHILPVMVGTPVLIRNSDATLHNVHTTSLENPAFNRAQLPNRSFKVVFDHPDIIRVNCDIHSQMLAYILVLPSRLFTMARTDGTYALSGVPPGKYRLVGWHEKYGKVTKEVEIPAGGAMQIDIAFTKDSTGHRDRT